MKFQRKVKTAIKILINNGIIELFNSMKGFVSNRVGGYRPDEAMIAFKALMVDADTGVMIDVGAHYGKTLAKFAENNWQVFAFEPDSKNRERLIWSYGDLENVVIDHRAVSDRNQDKATIYRSSISTGFSSLSPLHSSHQPGNEVSVITLETFFIEQGLYEKEVSFIKIDTEGYDLHVLKGIPWTKVSPKLILCEFGDIKTSTLGYTFHDLANYLIDQGYKLIVSEWYPLKDYGIPADWNRFCTYPCKLKYPKSWGNIFATNDANLYQSLLEICIINH